MSKSWKESIIEGAKCAVIAFAIVEYITESIAGWTRELLEYVRIYPDMPNILEFYIQIQKHKGPIALMVFLIILVIFSWKTDTEINIWHVIGIFPSLVGYGLYLTIKYFYLFTVT
jgi:hypothetical protein